MGTLHHLLTKEQPSAADVAEARRLAKDQKLERRFESRLWAMEARRQAAHPTEQERRADAAAGAEMMEAFGK